MVERTTAQHEKDAGTQRDIAPAAVTVGRGSEAAGSIAVNGTQNFLGGEKQEKREKTAGEKLFDFTVYAGIMWGLNEVITTIIGRGIMKGEGMLEKGSKAVTGKPEFLKTKYDSMMSKMPGGKLGGFAKQAVNIFILTIGGNLLVPVTKFLEDHKGKMVRWTDNWLESKDPKHHARLEQAHTEMDEAPKQSWATLWEGRLTVLAAAIGIDSLIGGNNAPSTKLLKNTPLNDWSSMTRASTSAARTVAGWVKPSMRETIKNARAISPHTVIESVESAMKNPELKHFGEEKLKKAVEGKAIGFAADNSFVLVLSAITAFCFYLTSKFFARKRDENKSEKPETAPPAIAQRSGTGRAYNEQLEHSESPEREDHTAKPTTRILKPEMLDRVAAMPTHAQVAG